MNMKYSKRPNNKVQFYDYLASNTGIINNTIDKVWSYFKMNRGTKYDSIIQDIKNTKKPF